MRALAGLWMVLAACTFNTSNSSELISPDTPDAKSVVDIDAASSDAASSDAESSDAEPLDADAATNNVDAATDVDAATPLIVYVLSPTGAGDTVADFGGGGGIAFNEDCPGGRVITGFDGDNTSSGICRLQAFCSLLTANPDGTVTTSDPQPTALHGNSGSFVQESPLQCPANQVVVGVNGRSSNTVRKFEISCASITWDYGTRVYTIGPPQQLQGTIGRESGQASSGNCEPGMVAGGFAGNAGELVDRFELHCFSLVETPQ